MRGIIPCVALLSVIFTFAVLPVEGGECCRGHNSLYSYHVQKWCPVFCCGRAPTGLYCCNDLTQRAYEGYIDHFCPAWFVSSGNTWVLAVIGLILIAILIASIVCCVRCCCFIM